MFAIAFGLMCATRLIAAATGMSETRSGYVYAVRFLAYLLIVAAIVDKNRPQSAASS